MEAVGPRRPAAGAAHRTRATRHQRPSFDTRAERGRRAPVHAFPRHVHFTGRRGRLHVARRALDDGTIDRLRPGATALPLACIAAASTRSAPRDVGRGPAGARVDASPAGMDGELPAEAPAAARSRCCRPAAPVVERDRHAVDRRREARERETSTIDERANSSSSRSRNAEVAAGSRSSRTRSAQCPRRRMTSRLRSPSALSISAITAGSAPRGGSRRQGRNARLGQHHAAHARQRQQREVVLEPVRGQRR